MNKTWYILACKLILFLLAISSSACNFRSSAPTSVPQAEEKQTGEPDRLGSWTQRKWTEPYGIANRPKGWKQIVQNSEFQLRETILVEYESYTSYTQKFGTYPRIDGSSELISLSTEFARQHLGFSDEEIENHFSPTTTV